MDRRIDHETCESSPAVNNGTLLFRQLCLTRVQLRSKNIAVAGSDAAAGTDANVALWYLLPSPGVGAVLQWVVQQFQKFRRSQNNRE